MKKITLLIALSIMILGCEGQKKQQEKKIAAIADSTLVTKPQTKVEVNKKYDDKGNLIQYDSTYSYFYSSPGMGNRNIISDSLYSGLKGPLREDYQGLLDENMSNLFFNDSLFKYDFFNDDYFSKRFRLNMQRFENMFQRMDSIKADMLRRSYPNGNIKKQ